MPNCAEPSDCDARRKAGEYGVDPMLLEQLDASRASFMVLPGEDLSRFVTADGKLTEEGASRMNDE